jgi:hypothetical protein
MLKWQQAETLYNSGFLFTDCGERQAMVVLNRDLNMDLKYLCKNCNFQG